MNARFVSAFLVALSVLLNSTEAAEPLPSVFNGTDLSGWEPDKLPECWRAVDGVLEVKNDPKQIGSILWTTSDYGDFVMELEFLFGKGRVDSGVFVRHAQDQIQIGNSGSKKRDMTASPYIAKKGYPVEAEGVAELLKTDDWNAMKIVAVGPRYDVWLNGKHVMSYTSDTALERGPVGLQLHPNTRMTISYRNLRLAELQ